VFAAALGAANTAAAQNPQSSAPEPPRPAAATPVTNGSVDLIVRHDDGTGAPVFETVTTDLSGIIDITTDTSVTGVELDGASDLMWKPTDPAYGVQWEHQLTGLETAWDVTRGDPSVVIAVVDSGVNSGPEFGTRLLPGKSFSGNDPLVDSLGHGTSVAAVAAAEANNGIGGVGVCSRCTILPVQVADANGRVPWSAAASGIVWAVDQGADILNLSFGSQSPSGVLSDAIDYATSRGVVVFAAAGNSGTDTAVYPAAYADVISVAAHDQGFNRHSWSSYGQWVDLAAPGCDLGISWGTPTTVCGTSFASPWAAGTAALLLSVDGAMSVAQVEAAIENTTVPNDWVRTGRMDASLLLRGGVANLDPVRPRISAGSVDLTGQYRGNVTRIDLTVDGMVAASDKSPTAGRFELLWDASTAVAGDHTLQVEAVDASGNSVPGGAVSVQVYEGSGFDDVVRNSFYDTAVTWMVNSSITSGTSPTTFGPDSPVTRAQLATFLWRYAGNPTATNPAGFDDTATNAWYSPAVDWLVDTGITTGTTPTTYSPDSPVTRAQLATFLWRYAGNPTP